MLIMRRDGKLITLSSGANASNQPLAKNQKIRDAYTRLTRQSLTYMFKIAKMQLSFQERLSALYILRTMMQISGYIIFGWKKFS